MYEIEGTIVSFMPGQEIPYTPKNERNKENPITVYIKYLSARGNKGNKGFKAYTREVESRTDALCKGLRMDALEQRARIQRDIEDEVDDKLFLDNVTKVTRVVDGKETEIMSPQQFMESLDNENLNEILYAMRTVSALSEGQVKNSSGGSGGISTLEQIEVPDSTVPIVPPETEEKETATTEEDSLQQP